MSSSSTSASPAVTVLYASHDLSLLDDGVGTNKPVVRKRAILDALQKAKQEDTTVSIDFQPLTEPAKDLKIAERIHDPLLVELFATGWQRWEALGASRDLYFSSGGRIDPEHWQELVPSQVAPRDTHQRPGASLHGQICYYCQDQMTPITQHTSKIIHSDLAVTLRAVELIKAGSAKQVYACTTEPGHHSGPQSYGGYCFLNHSALATSLLQEHYGKVGLLDVDYHAGNGGYAVFAEDPNVFFASLHADPEIEYPYCCGFADQDGSGAGKGTSINVPLPKNTSWREYQPELARCLEAMKRHGVKALVVSLGLDTLADDPECAPLAGFKLRNADYVEMGRMIRDLGVPVMFVQEGGYLLPAVGEAVRHVLVGHVKGDKR